MRPSPSAWCRPSAASSRKPAHWAGSEGPPSREATSTWRASVNTRHMPGPRKELRSPGHLRLAARHDGGDGGAEAGEVQGLLDAGGAQAAALGDLLGAVGGAEH